MPQQRRRRQVKQPGDPYYFRMSDETRAKRIRLGVPISPYEDDFNDRPLFDREPVFYGCTSKPQLHLGTPFQKKTEAEFVLWATKFWPGCWPNQPHPLGPYGPVADVEKKPTSGYVLCQSAPPGGVTCERCGSLNEFAGPNAPGGKYRCYECR